jgi:outer membrane lipoprotein-sorting protein
MRAKLVLIIGMLVMNSASIGTGQEKPAEDCDSVPVPIIKDVQIKYDGMKSIEITAMGTVPTGGYKNHSLIRRTYIRAPADGIWEYEMYTCKPSGIVTQVVTNITAKDTWESPPASLKGIRVFGDKNRKEVPVKWP